MITNRTPPKRAHCYSTYEEYVESRVQATGLQLAVISEVLYDALRDNIKTESD
mgnify:CR=1|jgi:hypothetical protein